jgi:hypothetical protein
MAAMGYILEVQASKDGEGSLPDLARSGAAIRFACAPLRSFYIPQSLAFTSTPLPSPLCPQCWP